MARVNTSITNEDDSTQEAITVAIHASAQLSLPESTTTTTRIVILATALVNIVNAFGNQHVARALLDSGSQGSFVPEVFAQHTKLHRERGRLHICGIGQSKSGTTKGATRFTLQLRHFNCALLHISSHE